MKIFILVFAFLYQPSLMAEDLKPFMLDSESIVELNRRVGKQRNAIATIRRIDQRRHRHGRYRSWFRIRPHARYQKVMKGEVPAVQTVPAPEEVIPFYAMNPDERKRSRVDWKDRRARDRARFVTHDRHLLITGKTIYETATDRYSDD